MEDNNPENHTTKKANIPPVTTLATYVIIAFFIFAFFSGLILKFYASFLFLFYGWIDRMWIAVVLLGVFQVVLMIPLRVINLQISNHINEFKEKTAQIKSSEEQSFLIKRKIKEGSRPILFYIVNFVIQLSSYITIGRLFLTDFYLSRLNPKLLFSFVPYPVYPIKDVFFKIPYPIFTNTKDFGTNVVLIVWAIIIFFQFIVYMYIYASRQNKNKSGKSMPLIQLPKEVVKIKDYIKYASKNSVLLFVISLFIIKNFPIGWQIRIFSGDISIPNRSFNTVTAIVTFVTILWFGMAKINRKSKLAKINKIDDEIIFHTQKDMFKDSLKTAFLVGLGAYFITRQIPSAFELSIFTFELIALSSPFTLDKLITKNVKLPSV